MATTHHLNRISISIEYDDHVVCRCSTTHTPTQHCESELRRRSVAISYDAYRRQPVAGEKQTRDGLANGKDSEPQTGTERLDENTHEETGTDHDDSNQDVGDVRNLQARTRGLRWALGTGLLVQCIWWCLENIPTIATLLHRAGELLDHVIM